MTAEQRMARVLRLLIVMCGVGAGCLAGLAVAFVMLLCGAHAPAIAATLALSATIGAALGLAVAGPAER